MYHSELKPVLACWPSDKWKNIGLLYIKLDSALPTTISRKEQEGEGGTSRGTDDNHNYDYFGSDGQPTRRVQPYGRSKLS